MKDEPQKSPDSIRPFFIDAVSYEDESSPMAISSDKVIGIRPARRTPGWTVLHLSGPEARTIVKAPYERVRALFAENGYRILSMEP